MVTAVVFTVVVGTRLVAPLFIARYPLPAMLLCFVADALDQSIFSLVTTNFPTYQPYDKALDVHELAFAYLATIRNWGGGPDFEVGRVLWYLRLVGVTVFEYSGLRWMLFVLPNTFEYFVLAVEGYKVRRDPNRLGLRHVMVLAIGIWVVVKLPQEWWLHVAGLDLTDEAKRWVVGARPGESWRQVLRDDPRRPLALGAGVLLCAVAARIVLRRAARHLPPPEWATTYDADRQGLAMGWRAPRRSARPNASFDWTFTEKVVLVSLVSAIFARILPGADTRVAITVLVTAFVIAVNTVVSEWLARRGTSWRNSLVEFAVMGVINTGTVLVADLGLGRVFADGRARAPTPLGTTLFLIGVLTLIVVRYDRAHAVYQEHAAAQELRRVEDTFPRPPGSFG